MSVCRSEADPLPKGSVVFSKEMFHGLTEPCQKIHEIRTPRVNHFLLTAGQGSLLARPVGFLSCDVLVIMGQDLSAELRGDSSVRYRMMNDRRDNVAILR